MTAEKRRPTESQQRAVEAQSERLALAYLRVGALVEPELDALRKIRLQNFGADLVSPPPEATFDWRTRLAIRPPGNQGSCYACTSFAIAAAIEANWMIAHPGRPISISVGYLHTCVAHAGELDPVRVCNAPADLHRTLTRVIAGRVATAFSGDYPLPPDACARIPATVQVVDTPEINGPNDARAKILSVGPIVADMYVWKDFFGYSSAQSPVYRPDKTQEGPFLHSVCVVGFDEDGWIIKNSFGADWGDGDGFATVAFGECGLLGAPPPAPNTYPREMFALRC
jgi:hypothetical protein